VELPHLDEWREGDDDVSKDLSGFTVGKRRKVSVFQNLTQALYKDLAVYMSTNVFLFHLVILVSAEDARWAQENPDDR